MKRLIIRKLIVISQSESRSLEVPFNVGLNLILGGNKTGKSSIIKSIFHTFGCDCKKVEKEWKSLISSYLVYFQYGERNFCVKREGKRFQIFEIKQEKYYCVIETEAFHEYSNCLMDIFEINMPCISKDGKEFNITPPLLFRFQYIDQDDGWGKIGDPFKNVAYIKDWQKNTNKYACGYLGDAYYKLQAQKAQLTMTKDEKKRELSHNQSFVSRISNNISVIEDKDSMDKITVNLENLIKKGEELRKKEFAIKTQLAIIENSIYVNKHKLHIVERNIEETAKDIHYAMEQEDVLVCPTCGATYSNGLPEQLNITSDYAQCERLRTELLNELDISQKELERHKKDHDEIVFEISQIETQINESQVLLSYSSFYKSKGQYEIYETCKEQLDVLQKEIDHVLYNITKLDDKINELKAPKRAKEIRTNIESECRDLADTINLSKTYIRLRDFVQVIDRTGSETPRLIYMYQAALYLYNLKRANSPFNFLVVDTPNQQGQDEENLENIFKSLQFFLSDDGQVIIGSERKTGLEEKANTILELTEKRRCLTQEKYTEHTRLLKQLYQATVEWHSKTQ